MRPSEALASPAARSTASISVPGPAVRPRGSQTRARSGMRPDAAAPSSMASIAASSVSPRCGTPSAFARRTCLLADASEILRQVDAEHRDVLLFQQSKVVCAPIRRGEDQVRVQAQHRLGRGAHDRKMRGLARDEGQCGIAGQGRQRGHLLRRQQNQHLVGAEIERDHMLCGAAKADRSPQRRRERKDRIALRAKRNLSFSASLRLCVAVFTAPARRAVSPSPPARRGW